MSGEGLARAATLDDEMSQVFLEMVVSVILCELQRQCAPFSLADKGGSEAMAGWTYQAMHSVNAFDMVKSLVFIPVERVRLWQAMLGCPGL